MCREPPPPKIAGGVCGLSVILSRCWYHLGCKTAVTILGRGQNTLQTDLVEVVHSLSTSERHQQKKKKNSHTRLVVILH